MVLVVDMSLPPSASESVTDLATGWTLLSPSGADVTRAPDVPSATGIPACATTTVDSGTTQRCASDLHTERSGDRSVRLHRRVRAGRGHRSLAGHLASLISFQGQTRETERKQGRPNVRGRDLVCSGAIEHEGFFDEFVDERGEVRPHYRQLALRLGALSPEELARRERLRDAAFRSAGITFTVYGEDAGLERTFPMDLVPRIIPADEWAHIEQGLVQRVTALNMFLDDLYVGERAAVKDGIVPQWLVTSSPTASSARPSGSRCRRGARCLVAGIDLVRDADGTYRVLEDNLRNPSGISYVLENRAAMTRVLPQRVRQPTACRPVDHYGDVAARRTAPRGARRPAGDPMRRRAHARRLQLCVLRARVPRAPDGCRARRGPRPRRRRARRVHAHDARAPARRRHLPPHRRRLPRPRRVPPRLDARRARADGGGPRRQRHDRERRRQRRRRRQGDVRVRARPHPLLPGRGADAPERRRPTCCGTRTSATRCSTGSTSSS